MNKNKALVLLFFTILLPFLYFGFFIYFFIRTFVNNQPGNTDPMFFVFFSILFCIIIGIIVLLIIYIKNVFKNEYIEESKRALWAVILFFGSIIAMPIYWYINIWKPIKMNQIIIKQK